MKREDTQARMSGKIRSLSAPFLSYFVMGVSSPQPDEDNVVQCALILDVVNQFFCSTNRIMMQKLTTSEIQQW